MKSLALSFLLFGCFLSVQATEYTPATAQMNPAAVQTLIIGQDPSDASWLLRNAAQLTALGEIVISGVADEAAAVNLVSSAAACNTVRSIVFRNCELPALPANLRMLTQVRNFTSENTAVTDGEQFYHAIADMPNVTTVTVSGSYFRVLPNSFTRLRVMETITLVNTDLQLARGYDRNTKTPDELRVTQSAELGFGDDALTLNYSCYNADAAKSHVQMFRDVLQGAWRASNEFYSPVTAEPFVKAHPLVKPPVPGLDVYPDVYTINSLTGSVLEYGSGTRILVPAMAFEDANGNLVNGNVDITYREFRDEVDVVLSGIPMKYDSGGVVGDFQSAGMFEMRASQGGEEIFLRDDKEVALKFAVTDTASDYNFYRLDEQNGWTYLENTGTVERDEDPQAVPATTRTPGAQPEVTPAVAETPLVPGSMAVNLYRSAIAGIYVRNWIRDTTDFDVRYNDTCYYGMSRGIEEGAALTADEKGRRSSRLYLQSRSNGKNYTVLSIHNAEGRWGFNTELSAYAGCQWKVGQYMSKREVNERFGKDAGINDCRIIQDGSAYYIELKYYWGYDSIQAEPVRLNADNEPVAVEEEQQERMFNSYTKKLNNRRGQVNRDNARQVSRQERRVERAHNDSVRAWSGLKKVMNEEEKTMDFCAWNNHVAEAGFYTGVRMMPMRTNDSRAIFQMIRIPTFGVYNCDRLARMANPVLFVSRAIAVAGAVIVPAVIHVVDKVRNCMYTYSGGAVGGVKGAHDRGNATYLMITDAYGNLYEVSEQQFTAGVQGGGTELQFEATQLQADEGPASVRNAGRD